MNDDLASSDALLLALSSKLRAYVDASARLAELTPAEQKKAKRGHEKTVRAGRELLASLDELTAQAKQEPSGRSVTAQSRTVLDAVLVFFDSWSAAQMQLNSEQE
jgi:hypothetical protein